MRKSSHVHSRCLSRLLRCLSGGERKAAKKSHGGGEELAGDDDGRVRIGRRKGSRQIVKINSPIERKGGGGEERSDESALAFREKKNHLPLKGDQREE